ncbi:MAG: ABC transporter ATP-binding protein [Verrucomicrobia bacterium]|nr:ABC transporter ATP-binding protein [Verrucomicrobiota bacterium]
MATIELNDVSLVYPLYGTKSRSLKVSVLQAATGGKFLKEEATVKVQALDRISFKLENGDRLGLIGHNGAGKTTLLKVLAKIYEPTSGKLNISGKLNSLFDIMVGMDHGLTGYENVLLRGLILGLSKKQIYNVVSEIEEFAELGEFIHLPLNSYSSGMLVRLGFAIITSISSEILLIDEVLSVGDARFIDKARKRISTLIDQSHIMVLSTHDHDVIRSFCNKVLWLEQGKIKLFGNTEEVFQERDRLLST